jgi:hypothetical protein
MCCAGSRCSPLSRSALTDTRFRRCTLHLHGRLWLPAPRWPRWSSSPQLQVHGPEIGAKLPAAAARAALLDAMPGVTLQDRCDVVHTQGRSGRHDLVQGVLVCTGMATPTISRLSRASVVGKQLKYAHCWRAVCTSHCHVCFKNRRASTGVDTVQGQAPLQASQVQNPTPGAGSGHGTRCLTPQNRQSRHHCCALSSAAHVMRAHDFVSWSKIQRTLMTLVPQVAWVGHLAQPVLAMHAWRSLWVVIKTTAACLRSPKLLLRNLRCMTTAACR